MSNKTLQRILKKVYGKPSWDVHKGHGSFVTFEFGKPKLEVSKKVLRPKAGAKFLKYPKRMAKVHGDWHLWIYCCHWEIRQHGRRIAHSESEDQKIDKACNFLNGQLLTKVVVTPRTWKTDFYFDLGGHLQTSSYRSEPIEMWMMYCPDGRVFTLRDDGKYAYRPGNRPLEEKHWLPFTF